MGTRLYETPALSARKARNRIKLTDRYYGKRDLLASWEQFYQLHPEQRDDNHLYDLRRRVKGYALDLAYRGADDFTKLL